jgi:hypothetical protein
MGEGLCKVGAGTKTKAIEYVQQQHAAAGAKSAPPLMLSVRRLNGAAMNEGNQET